MLYKSKKTLLTLLLSLILPFQASCNNVGEEEIVEEVIVEDEIIEEEQEVDFEKIEEVRKETLVNNTLDYYDSYRLDYNFVEFLPLEEDIKNIISSNSFPLECDFLFDNNIDELMEKIKNNSIEYQKSHPELMSAFASKHSDLELYEAQIHFQITLENLLKEIVEKNTNDLNEDFHRMQSLKIFYGDTSIVNDENYIRLLDSEDESITLALYDKFENIIIISLDNINYSIESKYIVTETDDFEESFDFDKEFLERLYFVLSHEINHLRQSLCECRYQDESDNLSYNEYVMTLIESSAESEVYNLNKKSSYRFNDDTIDYTYYFERKDEALLLLLGLTKNNDISAYYNAIFDTNINALNDFFGLETECDIYRFYRILYIVDSLNLRTNLVNDVYEEQELGNMYISDFEKAIGYAYRNEVFLMSLKNLVEYTYNNPNFLLEDNLLIFNILKNKIAESTYIIRDGKKVYDDSFVNQYLELEEKYIEFLAEYYQISIEELREIEDYEIYFYSSCLSNLVCHRYMSSYDYVERSKEILKEFSTLEAIVFTNSYNKDSYNELKNYMDEKILKMKK